MYFLEILARIVSLALGVLELSMFLRAILSWFVSEDNRFLLFLVAITEPFILPFRMLFEKMNWFQDVPMDVPFMATYLVLILLTLFL